MALYFEICTADDPGDGSLIRSALGAPGLTFKPDVPVNDGIAQQMFRRKRNSLTDGGNESRAQPRTIRFAP